MESSFLKIRHVTLLLLDIPVIVSGMMNPEDAVTGSVRSRKVYASRGIVNCLSMLAQEPQPLSAVRRLRSTNWWAAAPAPRQPFPALGRESTYIFAREAKDTWTMCKAANSGCTGLGKKKPLTNPNGITNDPVFSLSHAPPGQMGADVRNTVGNMRRTRAKHLLCLPTLKERHFWSLFLLLGLQPCTSYLHRSQHP